MKLFNFLLIFLLTAATSIRGETDSMTGKASNIKLPQYSEKGQLMFILYGKSCYTAGINIFMDKVLIDLMQSNVKDIDAIKDFQDIEVYSIDTPMQDVIKFWADKPHSAGLIAAPNAVYDRAKQTIKGEKEIYFRTPFIDIDGEGFDGDKESKTIHIRKNVRMTVRSQFANLKRNSSTKNNEAPAAENNSSKKDVKNDDTPAK